MKSGKSSGENSNNSIRKTDLDLSGPTHFFGSKKIFCNIRDHCVAQINIDVAGSKNARCIRARTTQMEGAAFTSERIRRYTGLEPAPYIPRPHLGEPNFMCKNVPITIIPALIPRFFRGQSCRKQSRDGTMAQGMGD